MVLPSNVDRPVITAFREPEAAGSQSEFKVSLGYLVRPCFQKNFLNSSVVEGSSSTYQTVVRPKSNNCVCFFFFIKVGQKEGRLHGKKET